MRVVSRDSARLSGGRIPGMREASIDLPETVFINDLNPKDPPDGVILAY
jgi:hypothetical protein